MLGRIARSQRGAFMVFFAILVPFFLGMIGFAVDAGFVYMQKAKMQDIADAAALAGAARLNDSEDREGHVTSAVKAYITANGMKITATNIKELDEEASLKPNQNNFQVAHGILSSVMDKDNVKRDHVRVVIAKRVPTFFIGILLPKEKEGVLVKAAAEAEYVEGEEAPVYSGPKIICSQYNTNDCYGRDTIKLENKGQDYTIYAGASNIDYSKLPMDGSGTLYHQHWDFSVPDGWNLVRVNNTYWDESTKNEKKALDEINALVDKKVIQYKKEASDYVNNREDYRNGIKNKRYIGYNAAGEMINNLQEGDDNIELYMDGTYASKVEGAANNLIGYNSILTNGQLPKTVKHIKTLIFGHHVISDGHEQVAYKQCQVATKGITYGNIYNTYKTDIWIGGEDNYFEGLIYTTGILRIGGVDNHYMKNVELFAKNNEDPWGSGVYLGIWRKVTEKVSATGGKPVIEVSGDISEKNNSDWHIYFGGSSSGSGSSGSDSGTSAHVRLVK